MSLTGLTPRSAPFSVYFRAGTTGTPGGTVGTNIVTGATDIVYASLKFETNSGSFNTGTGVFTVPVTGGYLVSACITISGTYVLGNQVTIGVFQNATLVNAFNFKAWSAGTLSTPISMTTLLNCVATDTISIRGSSAATTPAFVADSTGNYFMANKV